LPLSFRQQALSPTTSEIVLDILRDDNARLAAFGSGSTIDLPFDVAVKTGTSKGFRDNLTVGSTDRVTVAVWVGNFDGTPMQGVSGVTGAGPLFRQVMLAAAREESSPEARIQSTFLTQVEICPLSGQLPTPNCPHRVKERFAPSDRPRQVCTMHASIAVDRRNGLLAGPGCTEEYRKSAIVEVFDETFGAWARSANRPLAPTDYSPLCPDTSGTATINAGPLRIRYPYDGAVFLFDPGKAAQSQGIVIRVDAPRVVHEVRFFFDGRFIGVHGSPFEHVLPLSEGQHRLRVEAPNISASAEVGFEVR
jgi:penicillin-binding protein 1C